MNLVVVYTEKHLIVLSSATMSNIVGCSHRTRLFKKGGTD